MVSIARRAYIFLVCAVSLNGVAWAVIALLRNLLTGRGASGDAVAFQIAVIIIGLPVFLFHWLWAQRLATQESEEREAVLRRLYLYGVQAGTLVPFIRNTFDLIELATDKLLGSAPDRMNGRYNLSAGNVVVFDLIPLVVLALLWFYHQRVLAEDQRVVPEREALTTIRRLYIFGFSAAGLVMTTSSAIQILHWLLEQWGGDRWPVQGWLSEQTPPLLIGVALWTLFWRWAERLFRDPGQQEEQESVLRKVYLYLVVFLCVLGVVTSLTFIVQGLFRLILSVPARTGGDIRTSISVITCLGLLWAYHAWVLRRDTAMASEAPQQTTVRQIYSYLVAAVGFGALIEGVGGDISVLIQSLSESFAIGLKEQLAWFTAVLFAGMVVWIIPWRRAQIRAEESGFEGAEERRAVVRKIYLYFYIFVATMAVFSGAVYIVYQLLSLLFGDRSGENLLNDLGHAIAFCLIAVAVWLYHGMALRNDQRLTDAEDARLMKKIPVAVVDIGNGEFGRSLIDKLRQAVPSLPIRPIGLTETAAEAMGMTVDRAQAVAQLAQSELIVGPWVMAVAGGAEGTVDREIANAIIESPARKLLAPVEITGWDWAGVDRWKTETIVNQAVRAVKQMAEGKMIAPSRRLGTAAIVGIVIGVGFLLAFLAFPLIYFVGEFL
jgi:hypothetical protein